MTKLTTAEIRAAARSILKAHPGGVRWVPLIEAVQNVRPSTPRNTVASALVSWARSGEITKPSRGLWVLRTDLEQAEAVAVPSEEVDPVESAAEKLAEAELYGPFAQWLTEEADDASVARALGGSALKTKWGTPDVIGTTKPKASDAIPFPIEIVAAELKADAKASIVAFGQACAYRLFAHRSYIVMPETLAGYDRERLLALCELYGIGFVLWSRGSDGFRFQFEVRPRTQQPDTWYANEFAARIRSGDVDTFNALF